MSYGIRTKKFEIDSDIDKEKVEDCIGNSMLEQILKKKVKRIYSCKPVFTDSEAPFIDIYHINGSDVKIIDYRRFEITGTSSKIGEIRSLLERIIKIKLKK